MYPNPDPNPMQAMNFPQGQMVNSSSTQSPFQKTPTQQQVPNPYVPGQPQSFSEGGKISGKKMHYAHISKEEAEVLDKLQGKHTRHRKSKTRAYPGLESLLNNPHLYKLIKQHAKEHKDEGGMVDGYAQGGSIEKLKKNGRFGDTELVLMGRKTIRLLDELAGHKARNPKDGHPEYFSLGKVFGGIGKTIGKGVKSVGNTIGKGAKSVGKGLMNIPGQAMKGVSGILGNDDARHALTAAAAFIPGAQPFLPAIMGADALISASQAMGPKKNQASGAFNNMMNMGSGMGNGMGMMNQAQQYSPYQGPYGSQMPRYNPTGQQQQAQNMYGQMPSYNAFPNYNSYPQQSYRPYS